MHTPSASLYTMQFGTFPQEGRGKWAPGAYYTLSPLGGIKGENSALCITNSALTILHLPIESKVKSVDKQVDMTSAHLAEEYIQNKYEKVRLLHQTEKAEVWLATDTTGSFVVIKYIKLANLPYSSLKAMGKSLWPEVIYCAEDEASTIVVEEFINGKSFEELLESKRYLTETRARELLLQFCDGLIMLHRKGIIHRDIKPSNIILQAVGGHDFVRLIDYDAARIVKEEQKEDTRLLGTKGYAPPEQYGYGQTDQRSDIYSLGITFLEMLGENYNGWLRPILQKCTEVDARSRYQTVTELKSDLLHHRRNKLLKMAGIVAAAMVAMLVIWVNWQYSHQEKVIPPVVEEIMEEVKEKVPIPSVEEKTSEVDGDKPSSKENMPATENKPSIIENGAAAPKEEAVDDTGNNAVYAKYYKNGERLGAWTDRYDHPINNWGTTTFIPKGMWQNWTNLYPADWEVRVTVENKSNKPWENPYLSVWIKGIGAGQSRDYFGKTLAPGESCEFVVPLSSFELPLQQGKGQDQKQDFVFTIHGTGDQEIFGETTDVEFIFKK